MSHFLGSLVAPTTSASPSNPVKGQMYFDTDDDELLYYDGSAWTSTSGQTLSPGRGIAINGDTISYDPSDGTLTTKGDLLGCMSFGGPTIESRHPIGANGQVLTVNSSTPLGFVWADPPDPDLGGGGSTPEIERSSTLPHSPEDGDQHYYVANPGKVAEVIWHLMYNDRAESWDVLGGPPLVSSQNYTSAPFTNTSYSAISPITEVLVPEDGDYLVRHAGAVKLDSSTDSNSICYAAVDSGLYGTFNGTIASTDWIATNSSGATGSGDHWNYYSQAEQVNISSARTFQVHNRVTGIDPVGYKKIQSLEVWPIRVGSGR